MTLRGAKVWQVYLILLILCATVSLQGASLAAHEHTRASDHCCAVCHAGHLAMVRPVTSFQCSASTEVEWFTPRPQVQEFPDPLVSVWLSRAPPA
ncbi:MAG TPA: hypothetical protein VFA33_30380 [Bryobacteraceae bacterium]|nr:hypothetical protein [Bryobacteraceae bacterium]